jgi:hypothetical protein
MGAMAFGKPKILHSCWQHHKGLRCWVHFCTLHWVHMLLTCKFHFPRAHHELPFAPFLGHHPFESMIFLVCIFLVVITFGSTYLTHLEFWSSSLQFLLILMFFILCFNLHHLSLGSSWFIVLCFNPYHLNLNSF